MRTLKKDLIRIATRNDIEVADYWTAARILYRIETELKWYIFKIDEAKTRYLEQPPLKNTGIPSEQRRIEDRNEIRFALRINGISYIYESSIRYDNDSNAHRYNRFSDTDVLSGPEMLDTMLSEAQSELDLISTLKK